MQDFGATLQHIMDQPVLAFLLKMAIALLLLLLGWRIAKAVVKAEHRLLLEAHVDATATQFLRNTTYALLIAFIVVTGLELAGFPITSLLTVLGTMGLAVALSLKDSLSHVAAGLILMLLRPFRIGDRVSLAGQQGVVEGGYIFQTQLRGADDSLITLMNGSVVGAPIINYSRCDAQRLTLSLSLGQGTELSRALQTASATLTGDARVAAKPPLELAVTGVGTANVVLNIQVWVREAAADATRSDLLRALHNAFQQQQIAFADK